MHRKNGTFQEDTNVLVTYRELAPARALRGHVRSYFSFTPGPSEWRGPRPVIRDVRIARDESFCSPVFADGHASLVMDLGATCHVGGGWTRGTTVGTRAIGALRRVGGEAGARSAMIGVYLEPGACSFFLGMPAVELTDCVVPLDQVCGVRAEDLVELDERSRVDRLEGALLDRVFHAPPSHASVDVSGLARWVREAPASMTVSRLASAAGVSRRHLTRVFREVVGVSPKRYCRLARFRAGLAYAGAGNRVQWARVAAELGYVDQSHMIAEFREFSSLTPEALATHDWFHPFILDARDCQHAAE